MFQPPGDCPICGAFVPKGRKACRECGADEKSGWQEDDAHEGLDLPDGDFDYEAFLEEEFGSGPARKARLPLHWKVTALALIAALLAAWVFWAL